jgi:hypothetical protein
VPSWAIPAEAPRHRGFVAATADESRGRRAPHRAAPASRSRSTSAASSLPRPSRLSTVLVRAGDPQTHFYGSFTLIVRNGRGGVGRSRPRRDVAT